jgi:hypothetical protein
MFKFRLSCKLGKLMLFLNSPRSMFVASFLVSQLLDQKLNQNMDTAV